MKNGGRIRRTLRGVFILAAASMARLPATEQAPVNVSGVYEDQGVAIMEGGRKFDGVPSFHALVALEFDVGRALLLHARTERIHLAQTPDIVEITAYGADGKAERLGRWRRGVGYMSGAERVQLSARSKDETYVFALESAKEGALLRLTVRRERKTVFGPGYDDVGAFVFARRAPPQG